MTTLDILNHKTEDFTSEKKQAKYLVEERIKKTIAARNDAMEAIKKNFDRVLAGDSGVSIITGLPGIGKTFLVEQAVKELASSKVTYVYGKFRRHDEKPFIAISEAIEQMAKHLLTLPYAQSKNIKGALTKALGSDIGIITSLSPYAKKLLQDHEPINMNDYEKLKYRVRKAIFNFIATVSETLFPLIIFIDDLQWADTPSLEVIELICKQSESLNLLLLVAYRDNEGKHIKKIANLTKILQTKNNDSPIQLQELTDADIKVYLELILGANTKNVDYLARIIYALTLGNAFYIKEILELFRQEDIILYSPQRKQWVVRVDSINKLSLPAGIEQVIINKIDKLSAEDKSLLELIACLDGKVEYELLKIIINTEDVLLENQLHRLCKAAFLVKLEEDYQTEKPLTYSFAHDIILEFIYKKIGSERRAKIHYDIALALLESEEKTFTENNRLFMASQLLRSDQHLLTQENAEKWIYELYYAGMETKQAAAIEQALKIFEYAASLFPSANFVERNDLEMKINLELAECQFICARYQEAQATLATLLEKYNTPENLVTIKGKHLSLLAYSGDLTEVITLGFEILEHLNFKLSPNFLMNDILAGKLVLTNRKTANNKQAVIRDARILSILDVLTKMISAASITDDKLFLQILIEIGLITAKYGHSPYAAIGYTGFSYFFIISGKNTSTGQN